MLTFEHGFLAQFDHKKNLWQLLFASEQPSRHGLIVFAKRSDEDAAKFDSAVKLYLDVTKIERPVKFPVTYRTFGAKRCQIYSPLQRIVKKGAAVPVHCIIPGANDVTARVASQSLEIGSYSNPVFKRIATADSSNVTIYANDGQTSNYEALVKYSVQ